MAKSGILIGIDVGGTFTDTIVFDPDDGRVLMAFKLPSTPVDPAMAVITALERVARDHDVRGAHICHGTTVGTNTLIQRKGATVGLFATKGFTDVIELRRQNRPTLYDLCSQVSEPLVPRLRRYGVDERMDATGIPFKALGGADDQIAQARAAGCTAFAIGLLHSYANPKHEQTLSDALDEAFPGSFITMSSDVCPEFREYERTSTAVVNAYIGPAIREYIQRIVSEALKMGIDDVMIVKSNGGLTSPDNAQRYPVHLIESGPAAGMIATTAYARATGRRNIIAFDMGGTTAKAGIVHEFNPKVTDEFYADQLVNGRDVGGYPIRSAVLDIIEVGAGGGSIAWIDSGGVPKVGPESAGADPGPACYSRGGKLPTVTDAHAVIGTLSSETFEGMGVQFNRDLAVEAIETHIARPMGWTVVRAAHAILDLTVANMTEMVRLATVRRGLDPREFSILASGGAGPLHAAAIGAEVGVKEVVIPPFPGIFSAFGAVLGEVRHDLTKTILRSVHLVDATTLGTAFSELADKAQELLKHEPAGAQPPTFSRFADLRFSGQLSELRVQLGALHEPLPDQSEIEQRFRQTYQAEFGFDLADSAVELVNIHLVVVLPLRGTAETMFELAATKAARPEPYQVRTYLGADGTQEDLPVYRSEHCAGAMLAGPLLIDHCGSTVWVPSGQTACMALDGSVTFQIQGVA
ncbi:hydantoinase/oxoprolinase family protein [Alcaligenaceae bacterium CGII-47]|nr:hydantoinase/oxoprolinase family protein [Alcaligenaceae bacterium CGII-47]